MKFARYKTRAAAERMVKKLREKLPTFGFEVAIEPSGFRWAIRVYSAEGKFLAYSAPLTRAAFA